MGSGLLYSQATEVYYSWVNQFFLFFSALLAKKIRYNHHFTDDMKEDPGFSMAVATESVMRILKIPGMPFRQDI